jgi:hypothetical protein
LTIKDIAVMTFKQFMYLGRATTQLLSHHCCVISCASSAGSNKDVGAGVNVSFEVERDSKT